MVLKWNTEQINKFFESYNNGEISLDEYWETLTEINIQINNK